MTLVLPVPAPAMTTAGPSSHSTIRRCSSVSTAAGVAMVIAVVPGAGIARAQPITNRSWSPVSIVPAAGGARELDGGFAVEAVLTEQAADDGTGPTEAAAADDGDEAPVADQASIRSISDAKLTRSVGTSTSRIG